jgi:Tol biopolymer transport system component
MSDRDGDYDIYVLDLACVEDGPAACDAATRQVTGNDFEDRAPTWTPDGSALVFSSDTGENGRNNLFRVSAEGGTPEQLTSGEQSDGEPSVAPSGRFIVYQSWTDDDPETGSIQRLDLETGARHDPVRRRGQRLVARLQPGRRLDRVPPPGGGRGGAVGDERQRRGRPAAVRWLRV